MQPEWFANKVFGMEGYSHPECRELIAFGTENAYELTRVLKHWHAKPETGKEETPTVTKKKAVPAWGNGSHIPPVAEPVGVNLTTSAFQSFTWNDLPVPQPVDDTEF
jgi:hypothetical protein